MSQLRNRVSEIGGRILISAFLRTSARCNATDYASVWDFEYDADGRLTNERLNGQVDETETLYPLGERKVEFDKAGRRGPRGKLLVGAIHALHRLTACATLNPARPSTDRPRRNEA